MENDKEAGPPRAPEGPADSTFADLLARARRGDPDALDGLVRLVQRDLTRRVGRRMGSAQRARVGASDLVQDAWVEVLRRLDRFEGDTLEAFGIWVSRILESAVAQEARREGALKRRRPRGVPSAERLAENVQRTTRSPSSNAARMEDVVVLTRALACLREDHRRVITLAVLEEHSIADTARELGRTEAATKMLLSRARAALSLAIERIDAAPPP